MMSSLHRAAARSGIHRSAIPTVTTTTTRFCSGEKGSGVGHGGGGGGTVRDAGGKFGERGAALEEQYFRKKQAEQLASMKKHLSEEIKQHEKLIHQHEEAIQKSKEAIKKLEKD